MRGNRYKTPFVRFNSEIELERAILTSSQIDFVVKVNPLEEHYFEPGVETDSDHLIDF